MKLEINRAQDSDLSLMQRLFYQTVTLYGATLFTKSEVKMYSKLATNKQYWHDKFEKNYVFNAKLNGEIVGSFDMDKDGYIHYIFVHVKYNRRGIASSLYDHLENVAKDHNIKSLTTPINKLTRSFFESKEFNISQNVKKIVGGEEIVEYIGTKKL